MTVLGPIHILDANILITLADKSSPFHAAANNTVAVLLAGGAELRSIPQSLFEFWVVVTRPVPKNGLGLSIQDAQRELQSVMRSFPVLSDNPAYVGSWEQLIVKYGVGGKQAHDARYVASMMANGVTHLVTFDSDFSRYSLEGITLINPITIPAPGP